MSILTKKPLPSAFERLMGAATVYDFASTTTGGTRKFIGQQNRALLPKPAVGARVKLAAAPFPGASKGKALEHLGMSLLTGGAYATAGLGVAGAGMGIASVYKKMQARRMFAELQRRYPEIKRKGDDARKYFDMIVAYAPSLLRHHAAVGDFLKRQLEYPMSSVEFIKQLADLEAVVAKTGRDSMPSRFADSFTSAATGSMGSFFPKPKYG